MGLVEELAERVARLERRADSLVLPEVGGWQLIEQTQLAAPAASVTLSGIPDIYYALALWMEIRCTTVAEFESVRFRLNGDSGNNYDRLWHWYRGDNTRSSGAILAGTSGYVGMFDAANARANNFPPGLMYLPGYAQTDREKWAHSALSGSFGNASATTDIYGTLGRSRWRSTAKVTSLQVYPGLNNFATGSRFRLYGIL